MILAYKDHVSEMIDISDEDRNAFFAEGCWVAQAVHKVFNPANVNLRRMRRYRLPSAYAHRSKYKDGDEWGGVLFQDEPRQSILN